MYNRKEKLLGNSLDYNCEPVRPQYTQRPNHVSTVWQENMPTNKHRSSHGIIQATKKKNLW